MRALAYVAGILALIALVSGLAGIALTLGDNAIIGAAIVIPVLLAILIVVSG